MSKLNEVTEETKRFTALVIARLKEKRASFETFIEDCKKLMLSDDQFESRIEEYRKAFVEYRMESKNPGIFAEELFESILSDVRKEKAAINRKP